MDFDELKSLEKKCTEIFQGYSLLDEYYIKHFTFFDQSKIDVSYKYYFDLAVEEGIPTIEEAEQRLFQNPKLWSQDDEKQIESCRKQLRMFRANLKKAHLNSQIKLLQENISKEQSKLDALEQQRKELLGDTAESFANEKINDVYIINSFYKDQGCKEPLFSQEEFEILSEMRLSEYIVKYVKHAKNFQSYSIQKIAICPFFRNLFSICNDNPQIFYGKPVVDLTFHQSDLFSWGKYFQSIFQHSEDKMPPHIKDDPDKIIGWFTKTNNMREKAAGHEDKDNFVMIGADSSELKEAGLKGGGLDLGGGNKPMNMVDFLKKSGKM